MIIVFLCYHQFGADKGDTSSENECPVASQRPTVSFRWSFYFGLVMEECANDDKVAVDFGPRPDLAMIILEGASSSDSCGAFTQRVCFLRQQFPTIGDRIWFTNHRRHPLFGMQRF